MLFLLAVVLLIPVELSFAFTSYAAERLKLSWLFPLWDSHLSSLLSVSNPISWDWRILELLLCSGVLLLISFRKAGPWKAFFRTLAGMSLAILPLPVEILIFYHGAINLHFASVFENTSLEAGPLSFLVWFTNADLLYFSLLILAVSMFALTRVGQGIGASRPKTALFFTSILIVVVLSSLYLSSLYVPPPCSCTVVRPGGFSKQ